VAAQLARHAALLAAYAGITIGVTLVALGLNWFTGAQPAGGRRRERLGGGDLPPV